MMREYHVQFYEGLRGKFTWATHLRIAAGEVGALGADGRKTPPFTKRGSFQPDHDMERLVDYLEQRYLALGIETKRQRFNWRSIPQSNLIAKIEGRDSSLAPVILADHFDAAVAEDIYEKTGKRVTVTGASDNATATSLLLQAAAMLKNANPKREIMLLHFTGEEFPAVDLGARHFLTQFMQKKLDIYGVVITDFIGRCKPGSRRFNISSAAVKGSERLAAIALGASQDLYPDEELKAVYQSRDVPRNAVFQTDVLEFEFRGFPGILFNEDMDYSNVETFNPHYHQSTDVSANTDFEFSSRVARVAIETVLRIANDP